MVDVRKEIKKKFENRNKKGFLIEIDDYRAKPTKDGFLPPSDEIMQAAIEKYCVENNYKFKYIRLSNPIVFLLDDNEAYEAYPELRGTGRFVLHCVEFK
jgi:hypothetical protein